MRASAIDPDHEPEPSRGNKPPSPDERAVDMIAAVVRDHVALLPELTAADAEYVAAGVAQEMERRLIECRTIFVPADRSEAEEPLPF